MSQTKTITLVQAPQVPETERVALEKHYREGVLDLDYVLVVNYELRIDIIEKSPSDRMIIVAPGIPLDEILDLRKRVDAALAAEKPEDRVVVVNYECIVFAMPQNPTGG